MTELEQAIEAFLAKYPADAVLEWKDKPKKVERTTLRSEFGDLAHQAEKWNRAKGDPA